jgi:uridine kinase
MAILGVAGGSCSGKTTLVAYLADRLGPERCAVLRQDDYYRSQPGADPTRVNFDHPEAIDFDLLAEHLDVLRTGRPVPVPVYDFHTHARLEETVTLQPRPLLLVEGTLLLAVDGPRAHFDHSVFVDCPADVRLSRRLDRDVRERGRSTESVHAQFERHVEPMQSTFVDPSRSAADRVLDQAALDATLADESRALLELCEAFVREATTRAAF